MTVDANATASSAVEAPQAAATPAQDEKPNTVESSPAGEAGAKQEAAAPAAAKPKSLLDAMKAAVKPAEAKSESPPDKAKNESADPKSQGEEGKEGDEPPPFHQHPRWKAMVTRNKNLEAKTAEYAEKAQAFEKLQGFAKQANLSDQEIDAGFNIMALMKADPEKALQTLAPYWNSLLAATGRSLPPDIKQKVDQGLLPEAEASELARARATAATATTQVQQTQQQRAVEAQRAMLQGVTDWEANWKATDPDYAKKQQMVEDRVQVLLAQRQPRSVQEAVEIAQQARTEVENRLKQVMPNRTSMSPPPPAASSVRTAPKPASMIEAMRQAAAAGRS